MTLEEFIQLDRDSMIGSLEAYQQDVVKQLIDASDGNTLIAADKWLDANMEQTVVFGGEGKKKHGYREKIFIELEKFVCGCDDGTYDCERNQLKENGIAGKEYIISILSAAIGAKLGLAAAFIAPTIVLIFQSLGKITIKAWCAQMKEQRSVSQ